MLFLLIKIVFSLFIVYNIINIEICVQNKLTKGVLMKALKGLMIYVGIVLGSILGLALVLLCVMYFVPSFRIAGIGVIHDNQKFEEETINLSEYSGYNDIVVNLTSKKIALQVLPVDSENVSFEMKLGVFGISTEIVEYKIVKNVTKQDGKLQIFLNVTEPNGWMTVSTSKLLVKVPAEKSIGVVAKTESGSITIGDTEKTITLNDLTVTTTKGDLNLVNLGKGSSEKNLTLNTMNLTTGTGTFDLSDIENLTVLNTIRLTSTDGKFKFNKLYASVDVTGKGVSIEAEQITCGENGLSFVAENGMFKINKLSSPIGAENTIIADNISLFEINDITGKTGIVTNYGDISIDLIRDYTIIENENGDVSINTANNTIDITTYFGDINVNAYYATGRFSSVKGSITVNNKGDFADEYYTQINNVDGDVKIYNEVNRLLLKTTGRSDVDVTFGQIKANKVFQHKVNTSTQGTCIVYMPTVDVPAYNFTAKGIISGEIGVVITASESRQYYPNSSYMAASMNNCCFEFIGRIQFKGYSQLSN